MQFKKSKCDLSELIIPGMGWGLVIGVVMSLLMDDWALGMVFGLATGAGLGKYSTKGKGD